MKFIAIFILFIPNLLFSEIKKLFVNSLTSVGYDNINVSGQSSGPGGRTGIYTFSPHKGYIWAELISGEERKTPVSDIINKWREETGDILGVKNNQFTISH